MSFINKYSIFLTLGILEGMKNPFLLDKTVSLKDKPLGRLEFLQDILNERWDFIF